MDANSAESQEDAAAMIKLLIMGSQEIEQGKFRDVEAVFADLDEADLS